MKKNLFLYFFIVGFIISLFTIMSCKKDSEVNPFDDPTIKAPTNNPTSYNPDPNSFEYLYKEIFYPTCANSGCHDGSFEPDFRTLSSAYNNLVYHPVISNNASYDYTYRVVPGNSNLSLLKRRLLQVPYNEIGQGRMPWIDTTWYYIPKNKQYIQNIINWIDAGAKDIFGTTPTLGNKEPKTMGIQIYPTGNTTNPYSRSSNSNPIEIPQGSQIDVWAFITDDSTTPQNMLVTDIKFSTLPYDFTNAVTKSLVYTGTTITGTDVLGNGPNIYTHKLSSFNLSAYPVGTILYLRTYVRDTDHNYEAETPNDGTIEVYLRYYTIKII